MNFIDKVTAYQNAHLEYRATPIGRAFYRYKNALTLAVAREAEDSFTDKARVSTKEAHEKAIEAEHELLRLLNAPAELTGGVK